MASPLQYKLRVAGEGEDHRQSVDQDVFQGEHRHQQYFFNL